MFELSFLLDGKTLKFEKAIEIVYEDKIVAISSSSKRRMNKSVNFLRRILQEETIYGVNTNFGGLAVAKIDNDKIQILQKNLLMGLKCGCGKSLKKEYVRAAMLLRANSLAKGVSGIRIELIDRIIIFLNNDYIPVVPEYGSIGASGDLVQLSYIAGAIIGLNESYIVETPIGKINCIKALDKLGLESIDLEAKEGLALVNGTSLMTGIALTNLHHIKRILDLTVIINSFYLQALNADIASYCDFIHKNKPHVGQIQIAKILFYLLNNSKLLYEDEFKKPVQDRYSIRCLPQYLGPIFESIDIAQKQIEIEMNSANDNPIFDAENSRVYHGGNFLGQYVSSSMDQLRYGIGLLVKQLDTQIALLVTPEFSNGLTGSLTSYENADVSFGLKGLQITANSLMPLILYNCQPIAHLYPTHAEQYNQNINSQGYNSAKLTADSIEKTYLYLGTAVLFALQATDLRAKKIKKTYNSKRYISRHLVGFYQIASEILQNEENENIPFISRNKFMLDESIERLTNDLMKYESKLYGSVKDIMEQIKGINFNGKITEPII